MNFILGALLIFIYSHSSYAVTCSKALSKSEELLFMRTGDSLSFTNIEVFRQNNDMGPQQFGSLTFTQSSEFQYIHNKAYSFIGLTDQGTLYHVISYGENRTVALKLSAKLNITDFKITNLGRLIATNGKQSFIFSSKLWNTPASKLSLKKWKDYWQISSAVGIGLKYIFWPDVFLNLNISSYNLPVPAIELGMVGLGAFVSAFTALYSYEDYNKNPNGFIPIDIDYNSSYWYQDEEVVRLSNGNVDTFSIIPQEELPTRLAPELSSSIED